VINQTQAPPTPAAPRRRRDALEFLRHAGSIGEFDVAAFAIALHELMGRHGLAIRGECHRSALSDAELWGNVNAGLEWLGTLQELAPEGSAAANLMQNRLEGSDPDALLREMERARNRAKWCGGMPLWLVVANSVALLFCTLTAAVVLVRGPSVVGAGPPIDYATPAEVRALEQRISTLQDDQAFVVGRLMDKIERLQAEGQAND
jgi:hypothetical protein